jgi:hypothetical protein
MSKSAFPSPVRITDGISTSIEKIELKTNSSFSYDEKWLQNFLFDNPSSIPIEDIDNTYTGMLPICCELNTPAGPLDILYITQQGKLVIVEVKLWRNPEARRKVVAQVIDYAKELNKWDYEDLQREISKQTGKKGNVLYELVKSQWPESDEATFVDSVSRSLRKGDFLLLIIGDGIQEGTENIADFMNNVAQLQFTLGLLEVAIFKLSGSDFLVQPRVLAKTVIVERTVIELTSADMVVVDDEKSDEANEAISSVRAYYIDFWCDYLAQMQLDDVGIPHSTPSAENFFLYPAINKQSWISAYVTKSSQKVGVYFRAPKEGYGEMMYGYLLEHRQEIDKIIGVDAFWEDKGEGREKYISREMPVDDVHAEVNRQAIFEFYNTQINNFVNAFRPLLKDYEP